MTKRAEQALRGVYDPAANPAIGKLVEFAAQNPGLEFGNYGNWTSYNQERASITRDWKRFTKALWEASQAGVTDKDVIEAAPRAYSGRLEWVTTAENANKEPCPACGVRPYAHHLLECSGGDHRVTGHWEYCTGQYWPTEYRKAAATVLEYATREHLRSLPPKKWMPRTIAELKALNKANGGCWFNPGEMRFFGTRIESEVIKGCYFITSEQQDEGRPRKFTIRSFDETGSVGTVGEFHHYHSKADAIEALNERVGALPV